MKKNKLLFLVTVLVYLFLIGPLVVIMAASFSDTNYLKFPGEGFTLRWYQQVFTMSAFAKAAKLSLFIALGGTAIALLLGLPAAYALNRYNFKGKDAIKTVFLSPVLIPCIVLGFIMLRYVVNQYNLAVIPSLLIGHTLLSIPYIMRVVTSSAVVGSSAIISRGLHMMAMAIMMRWRMPPESSCGYCFMRLSGSGISTRRSFSSTISRASALEMPLWMRSGSIS